MRNYPDVTGKVGPFPGRYEGRLTPSHPMYSFGSIACAVIQGIVEGLHDRGLSEDQILEILQSKSIRWALDGDLGEQLHQIGKQASLEL